MKRTDEAADAGLAVAVWDLPIRLFHWLLVGLIALSWWSAENERVDLHIWSGIAVLTLLMFRILWGFFGSSTARFANFLRGPAEIANYLRRPGAWKGIGHTPLGALSVVALLAAIGIQVGLGLVSSDEDGTYAGPLNTFVSFDTAEAAHDLHETFFYVLLALIAVHVAAILVYRLFIGKRLTSAMLSGKTRSDEDISGMKPAKWWVAVLCLIASIAFSRWIIAGAPPFGG